MKMSIQTLEKIAMQYKGRFDETELKAWGRRNVYDFCGIVRLNNYFIFQGHEHLYAVEMPSGNVYHNYCRK